MSSIKYYTYISVSMGVFLIFLLVGCRCYYKYLSNQKLIYIGKNTYKLLEEIGKGGYGIVYKCLCL